MSVALAFLFPLVTGSGPMDQALRATEAPPTLRAAFMVEMTSDTARRVLRFDPRLPPNERWQLVEASGEDGALDDAAAAWGAEIAPDGRLFPDDLRASLGQMVEVEDLGTAWRVRFDHVPSENDSELDVWAVRQLEAEAWLEPVDGAFLRLNYVLPAPVRGPDGGRLTRFKQSYLLETDPVWGLSYVSRYSLSFEAKAAFRTIRRDYDAVISDATFFFASSEAERQFVEALEEGTGLAIAER
ncbi:hypothetical protein RYZ27_04470 [Hyphomonas sp. FCG-A18]|uniref:hypothetical protein n=1 Tax=Hyphomonas sp. FCG-A18 TaxID=3080019 RepID=UPI002B2ACCFE|nr:hypothetical protein RYZ27_04470 [Hyphomonas sp. FCG-A18]